MTCQKSSRATRAGHKGNDDKVRVMVVIKIGDEVLQLDLKLNGIAKELETCGGKSDIETLFSRRGGAY